MDVIYDVIIIGAGPAGLTAGLYTSRAKLNTLIIEREKFGGELLDRDLIENYPGYPNGVSGPELGSNMASQVMNYGTQIQFDEVEQIDIDEDYKTVKTAQGNYRSKALIIAGGAHPMKLGVPGEQEFADRGVFYCATCDGPRFANKEVAVAGGGNSGMTEALLLARMVSKVTIIEMLPQLTGTKILQERISSNPKIETMCGVKIEAIRGDDQVKALDLLDMQTGQKSTLEVDGILVWIGLIANTDYLKGKVPLNEKGQILVNAQMETEIPGVFAAGDIRHNSPMQITTAVGDGATAALSLERYLQSLSTA
ncbi:NAD(P)/FAD-dependent oxidoreductase [Chloroflexota bacterium]